MDTAIDLVERAYDMLDDTDTDPDPNDVADLLRRAIALLGIEAAPKAGHVGRWFDTVGCKYTRHLAQDAKHALPIGEVRPSRWRGGYVDGTEMLGMGRYTVSVTEEDDGSEQWTLWRCAGVDSDGYAQMVSLWEGPRSRDSVDNLRRLLSNPSRIAELMSAATASDSGDLVSSAVATPSPTATPQPTGPHGCGYPGCPDVPGGRSDHCDNCA